MATYKKSDLIKELTEKTGVKRKEVIALLDNVFEIACREAQEGGFTFPGLCKIDMTLRKQRRMRNPQTGQPILITEHMAPRIRILKKARDLIIADGPKQIIELDTPVLPLAPEAPASVPDPAVPAFTPAAFTPPFEASELKPEVTETPETPVFTPPPFTAPLEALELKPEVSETPETPAFTPAPTPDFSLTEHTPEIPEPERADHEIPETATSQTEETPAIQEQVETDPPAEEQPGGVIYDDFSVAVSFKCKACDGEIEAPAAAAGYTSECPVCGQPVLIPTVSEPGTIHGAKPDPASLDIQVEAAAEKAFSEAEYASQKNQTIRIDLSTLDANAPEAPKPKQRIVSFFCKNCQQELEAPTEMMGMKSECPDCGAGFEVPFFSDPGTLHGSDLEKTDAGAIGNLHNRTIRIEMPDF